MGTRLDGRRRIRTLLAAACVLAAILPAARAVAEAPGAFAAHRVDDRLSDYPRLIRLAHAGDDNDTLLAAADGRDGGLPVSRSVDGGVSWSPSGVVHEGSWACCAAMVELPRAMGDSPEGAVLAAGTIDGGAAIVVYRSLDHGRSWTPFSTVVAGGQGNGLGLWEPEFTVDAAGRLVCFFSDERAQADGYSQVLAHVVSSDGGRTWGAETRDIAVRDNTTRPGMARVVRVPGGSYVMAYEVCGPPGCAIHTRTSPDAEAWGDPADLGHQVQNRDGAYFVSSPALTWVSGGAPEGRLIVTGKYLRGTDRPDSGRLLFVTTDLAGQSAWDELPAPAAVSVVEGGDHCANYSSSLLPSVDGAGLLQVAGQSSAGGCGIVVAAANAGVLPYSAPFGQGAVGWNSYGGDWVAADGTLSNRRHAGLGDKAVAGSTEWADAVVSGDVRLDDPGADAGLLARVSDPSAGVDALRGYTVGIDAVGGQLYLGRFTNGWTKLGSAGLPDGVTVGRWYRLTLRASGCTFTVEARDGQTGSVTGFERTDDDCALRAGQIGIRTHNGRASWRSVDANGI